MKFIALSVLLYLVSSSEGQSTISSESTTTSLNCPAPKQLFHDEDGFAVQLNQDVVHIYVKPSNSYIILNPEVNIFNIADGNNKTYFGCEAKSGFSGMFNPKTDLLYVVTKHVHPFDFSQVFHGNFSVVPSMIDYASEYTDKVLGSDIDTTQPNYANTTMLLQDYAATTNHSKWLTYPIGIEGKRSYWDSDTSMAKVLHELLQPNTGYTVDWGVAIIYVAVSEQYKKEEECQTAFIDVMMNLIKDYNMDFDSTLMEKLYEIVSTQEHMTKEEAIQKYNALLG